MPVRRTREPEGFWAATAEKVQTNRLRLVLRRARLRAGMTREEAAEGLNQRIGLGAPPERRLRGDCYDFLRRVENSMRVVELEIVGEMLEMYGMTWVEALREAGVPEEIIGVGMNNLRQESE